MRIQPAVDCPGSQALLPAGERDVSAILAASGSAATCRCPDTSDRSVLDIALVGILIVSVFAAARNGITKEAIRIASLFVGLIVSMWGYGLLAQELQPWIQNGRAAAAVSFASIFLGCLIAGALLAHVLAGVWSLTGLRWLDMALGAGFGMIRGLLISAVLVFGRQLGVDATAVLLLGLVAFQPVAGTSQIVADSKIAPWVMNVARTAVGMAPKGLKEAFGKGAAEIEEERAGDRA